MSREQVLADLLKASKLERPIILKELITVLKRLWRPHLWLATSGSGMCGERRPLPALNFTGKMGLWTINFMWILKLVQCFMTAYSSSDRAFFDRAFDKLLQDFQKIQEKQELSEEKF